MTSPMKFHIIASPCTGRSKLKSKFHKTTHKLSYLSRKSRFKKLFRGTTDLRPIHMSELHVLENSSNGTVSDILTHMPASRTLLACSAVTTCALHSLAWQRRHVARGGRRRGSLANPNGRGATTTWHLTWSLWTRLGGGRRLAGGSKLSVTLPCERILQNL